MAPTWRTKVDLTRARDSLSVGFTGTQEGMTASQLQRCANALGALFERNWPVDEFHHGDCIGADAQAHDMLVFKRIQFHIHPPEDPSKQASCKALNIYMHPPKPYLDRNRDIVDVTNLLVATPKGTEKQRSGTWYTVRQARLLKRYIIIIWPDGSLTEENRND